MLYVSSPRDGSVYRISRANESGGGAGAGDASGKIEKLAITSFSARDNYDTRMPSNAFGNGLCSRWLNRGDGSWGQIDLGSQKTISYIDIAWYRGDARQNNFMLSMPDDGTSFTRVYETRSTGMTDQLETYDFPDVSTRYLRVTVNANNESNWARITEIAIFG
jgi:hypothetical protein